MPLRGDIGLMFLGEKKLKSKFSRFAASWLALWAGSLGSWSLVAGFLVLAWLGLALVWVVGSPGWLFPWLFLALFSWGGKISMRTRSPKALLYNGLRPISFCEMGDFKNIIPGHYHPNLSALNVR